MYQNKHLGISIWKKLVDKLVHQFLPYVDEYESDAFHAVTDHLRIIKFFFPLLILVILYILESEKPRNSKIFFSGKDAMLPISYYPNYT